MRWLRRVVTLGWACSVACVPAANRAPAGVPSGGGSGGERRCANGTPFKLGPPSTAIGGSYSSSLVIGDIDGDRRTDAIAGSATNSNPKAFAVFSGNADGSLSDPQQHAWPRQGSFANEVALGDLDGDGKLDVVGVGDGNRGYPAFALNRGDGSFGDVRSIEGEVGASSGVAVVGDFDGNQTADIAFSEEPGVSVVLDPAGRAKVAKYDTPGRSLAAADFNGDGRLDLAQYWADDDASESVVFVMTNKGDGRFAAARKLPLPTSHRVNADGITIRGMGTGDVDGDGRADIVAMVSGSAAHSEPPIMLTVLRGHGDGNFDPYVVNRVNNVEGSDFTAVALAVGDLNGDRHDDVVIGDYGPQILGFLAGANGTFGDPLVVPVGTTSSQSNVFVKIGKSPTGDGPAVFVLRGYQHEQSYTISVLASSCR